MKPDKGALLRRCVSGFSVRNPNHGKAAPDRSLPIPEASVFYAILTGRLARSGWKRAGKKPQEYRRRAEWQGNERMIAKAS